MLICSCYRFLCEWVRTAINLNIVLSQNVDVRKPGRNCRYREVEKFFFAVKTCLLQEFETLKFRFPLSQSRIELTAPALAWIVSSLVGMLICRQTFHLSLVSSCAVEDCLLCSVYRGSLPFRDIGNAETHVSRKFEEGLLALMALQVAGVMYT